MSLRDEIAAEIRAGSISARFTLSDLLRNPADPEGQRYWIGSREFSRRAIQSVLNNLRLGPGEERGHDVGKKGAKAQYRKYADGTFSLIGRGEPPELPEMDEDESEVDKRATPTKRKRGTADDARRAEIARAFVDYLRNKPFRLLLGSRRWFPAGGAVTGWQGRLSSYEWPVGSGNDWSANDRTITGICGDIQRLLAVPAAAQGPAHAADAEQIYDRVRAWGNPRARRQDGTRVLDAMRRVSAPATLAGTNVRGLPLDSTWTKLYAFTRPHEFVIYDSRVAFAILSIAEDIFRREHISHFRAHYPSLGHMNTASASGTRPRGLRFPAWPNAYGNWMAQLNANSLCRELRECLNALKEDGRSSWTLREVEAVLFMEGY